MAGQEVGSLYYDLTIDDKKLKQGLDNADRQVKSLADGISGHWDKSVAASKRFAVAIAAVTAGLVAFGASSIKAFAEAEKAQAQLRHAVIEVTHATEEQLKQTERLANSLERKGVLDADAIKMGLAQLSTFGLSNKAVQRLGGSLADLAVNQFGVNATGEQLSDTANMIAKALNNQFGILEKSGIRFTAAQKHAIEFGTEMEKVDAINKGFAQNLKFTNEVALTTTEGKLAKAKVAFENLKESVGEFLVAALGPVVDKLSTWIQKVNDAGGPMEYLKKLFDDNKGKIQFLAGAIAGALVPALVSLAASIWGVMAPLLPFMIIGGLLFYLWNNNKLLFAMLAGAVAGFGLALLIIMLPALVATTTGFLGLAIAVLAATWPFIVIGAAIGALAYLIIKHWNWIKETVGGLFDKVVGWFSSLPEWIKRGLSSVAGIILAPFKTAFNAIAMAWNNTIGRLSFKMPDWVPGLGGKGFSMPKLPMLAEGGLATGPVLAGIGEAGKEAVLPLSYLDRYNNLFDRIEKMATGDTVNNTAGATITIGDVYINSQSDADYFFTQLDRRSELRGMGVTPRS